MDIGAYENGVSASRLAFDAQPNGVYATLAFGVQPSVSAVHSRGRLDTSYKGAVTLSVKLGSGAAGAVLGGTTSVAATNGEGVFTNLSIGEPGTGYVLLATSGTLLPVESLPFNANPLPAHLVFTTQPAGAEAGKPFQQQPVVLARDANDVLISGYNGPVTLGIKAGTGTTGATLTGTTTVLAVDGVATFTELAVDRKGAGYVLEAFVGTDKLGESSAFNVAPAAQRLVFSVQPGGATDDWPFTTQPTVSVVDNDGDTATLNRAVVTLAIKPGTGASSAILNGTSTSTALHGVAGFNGLGIPTIGSGYVLTASSPGLTYVDSTAFNVTEAPKLILRQSAANDLEVSVHPSGANIIGATVALYWKASELAAVSALDIYPAAGWSVDTNDTTAGLTVTLSNAGTNVNGVVLTLHLTAQPGFSGHSATVSFEHVLANINAQQLRLRQRVGLHRHTRPHRPGWQHQR
jgi:hypothetical protein